MSRCIVALLCTFVTCVGCSHTTNRADLVIINARVWTGVDRDAQAVAVKRDRIAAVGSDRTVRRWIGPETKIINAEGRRLIPGITDAHIHIVAGGLQLSRLQLRDIASREEFVSAVAAAARDIPEDTWILGGRWSVESWSDPQTPQKEWVDAITGDKPLFLSRMDGHQALANSAALRLAGIDRNGPPDPPGGAIDRDPVTGEPTGILKDAAMALVSRKIPPPSQAELDTALRRAMNHLNSLGVTSVHDMSGPSDLPTIERAHSNGVLTVRIRKYVHVDDWSHAIEEVEDFPIDDEWLRVVGFKGYMDGSLGSRTAYMYHDYADAADGDPYPSGLLSDMASPPKKLRRMVEAAREANLQPAVHAIGTEANHILLDAYQAVLRKYGPPALPPRIEHAQHLLPEDISRLAQIGAAASMQPFHKADDGRYAEKALHRDDLRGSYAFRSILASGAMLCFGSDWPVVTCDPFEGMAAAVTSKTLDGKTWLERESLTTDEALRAYTVTAPIIAGDGSSLGTIEPGKLADMVILTEDVLPLTGDSIATVKPILTLLGGTIVYDKR
jgi:predicted amidohydrolase YtcJ